MRSVTCQEFVEFLADYLSGELSEAQRAEFNGHLALCPSCVAYMKTYQEAVKLGKAVLQGSEEPVPETVPEELVQGILAARRKGG